MIGRLAPSPTGAQHLGNARTFLIAWLLCRRQGGRLWLRIEDLETPRIKGWATAQAIDDLRWLGLDWDVWEAGPTGFGEVRQSHRIDRYLEVLRELQLRELVYPCTCTRSEVEAMAGAPHEPRLDGPIYPGTCAGRSAGEALELSRRGIAFAWRFRMPEVKMGFVDHFAGEQALPNAARDLGDFVVGRSQGGIAYQLAVVVDDHDMHVDHVVRGDDLLLSTFRQLAIYQALQWAIPDFCHLPLVVGNDGRRLAKRHGDTRLSLLREAGIPAARIIGYLAWQSGMLTQWENRSPAELLGGDPLAKLPAEPLVFAATDAVAFFRSGC
jgi:glutamyl-tRNA synthetase